MLNIHDVDIDATQLLCCNKHVDRARCSDLEVDMGFAIFVLCVATGYVLGTGIARRFEAYQSELRHARTVPHGRRH